MERVNAEILKLNSKIAKNIKNSMNSVNGQCDSVQKLIQAEENLDIYTKNTHKEIIGDFDVIIDWFSDFFIQGSQINKEILNEIWVTKTKIKNTEQEI